MFKRCSFPFRCLSKMWDYQITPAVSQLLSKSQVAERYQCSTRTVDRLRKDDNFPAPLKIDNLCCCPNAFLLDRLMPTLSFSVALRIVWTGSHVAHSSKPSRFLEVFGDKPAAVVGNDSGLGVWILFTCSL